MTRKCIANVSVLRVEQKIMFWWRWSFIKNVFDVRIKYWKNCDRRLDMLFSYSPALKVKHLGRRHVISLYWAQCYKGRPPGFHWIALWCIYMLQASCRPGFIFQEIGTTTENVLLKLDYYKVSLGKLIKWSVGSETAAVERLSALRVLPYH